MKILKLVGTIPALAVATVLGAALAPVEGAAVPLHFQGFETDTTDWNGNANRVASGTGGIASASGGFHAESLGVSAFHFFGTGSSPVSNVASVPYVASLDFYLDVTGGWANDTRFDYSVALNRPDNSFLRDFVFNAGFYDDNSGPGAGTDRFVISASNNSGRANSFPKNPGRDPITIGATGWYTFQHSFFDDGGTLGAELSVLDSGGTSLGSWSLGSDPILDVGGERYGWIVNNEFSRLAYDNTSFSAAAIPLPAAGWLLIGAFGGLRLVARRGRKDA